MYAGTILYIAMMHADNLILKAKQGNEGACNKLVQLWYKRIYNFALKYLGEHHMASDVAQKTFISMYSKINSLEDVAKFRPWLYRIASNYCHEEYRKKTRRSNLYINKNEADERKSEIINIAEGPAVEKTLHQMELNKFLEWALQQLSSDQREIIIMKEYEGLKFREIAEALDVSENTVKSRLYYGLTHLRNLLDNKKISKESLYYEG